MSTRDSNDDLRNFMPDMAAILREADPAHAEKKLKDALDNPELDEALAEVRALKAREAKAAKERASAFEVPVAGSGAAVASEGAAKGAAVGKKKRLSAWAVYALAVLAALVPAGLVFVLVKRGPPAAEVSGSVGSGPESVRAGAMSAAPSAAVNVEVDAGADTGDGAHTATDAGAPDASTAPAIETTSKPQRPPLPVPARAPLDKGGASEPPKGPASEPRKGPAPEPPKGPAPEPPKTAPAEDNDLVP